MYYFFFCKFERVILFSRTVKGTQLSNMFNTEKCVFRVFPFLLNIIFQIEINENKTPANKQKDYREG